MKQLNKIIFNSIYIIIYLSCHRECASLLENRIFGGFKANISQFPYYVLLQLPWLDIDILPFKRICGGSLISQRWILTAAKCRDWLGKIPRAIMGTDKIGVAFQSAKFIHKLDKLIVHPHYKQSKEIHFNIAMLRLEKEVNFTEKINATNLPHVEDTEYQFAVTVGFGYTNSAEWVGPTELKGVDVQIYNGSTCRDFLGPLFDGDYQLCGQWSNNDGPCDYDIGNGLIAVRENGEHVIIGVVDNTQKICGQRELIKYSKVSASLGWIRRIMVEE